MIENQALTTFFFFTVDMKDKPLEEWKPTNRVEMDAYRKRLVEVITFASVSGNIKKKRRGILILFVEIYQLWLVY